MAIDVLLTGSVVSGPKQYDVNGVMRVKVTLEARDAQGKRVNIVCSSANDRLAGSLELLEVGQAAAVRGHAVVPHNNRVRDKEPPQMTVYVTDVIILN